MSSTNPKHDLPDRTTGPGTPAGQLARIYTRWVFTRAILHRGWWLLTSLYLVTDANLEPLQLVLLGTGQGLIVLAFEVPTGIVADSFSRKWSLVISQVLMGTAMFSTSQCTTFVPLLLTQMLWGLSWTFASGADVAWISDEQGDAEVTQTTLISAARWEQVGAATGLIFFGVMGWLTSPGTAMAGAGVCMVALSLYVIRKFTETHKPRSTRALAATSADAPGGAIRLRLLATLSRGIKAARQDRTIATILIVFFLINGADEAFSRLLVRHLVTLGLPVIPHPIVWLTLLGLATLAVGVVALYLLQRFTGGEQSLKWIYLTGVLSGTVGLLVVATAPNFKLAMAGVLVVHGIGWSLTRTAATIWLNRRAVSKIRATLQSFLSQAENLGEVMIGVSLAFIAQISGIPWALTAAAAITFCACVLLLTRRA